jgi:site-specific recombinase XerD
MAIANRRKRTQEYLTKEELDKLLAASLERGDMLRHSCGYALVNKGTDIRIIQGYLGHRSISSTVRYTNLDSKRFAKLF